MTNLEIEAKIRVPDLAVVENKLKAAGAMLKAERVYERNVRYENAENSLTPAGKVVRLRQDTRTRLTYKEPTDQANAGALTRTELEVAVSDFEMMDAILGKLGYHSAWLYEKHRTTYEVSGAEVVLDELPFGYFIEVEGAPDAIERVLSAIGLADVKRIEASYSDLFFRIKERLQLPFNDLTFENFKGTAVPDNVFV